MISSVTIHIIHDLESSLISEYACVYMASGNQMNGNFTLSFERANRANKGHSLHYLCKTVKL